MKAKEKSLKKKPLKTSKKSFRVHLKKNRMLLLMCLPAVLFFIIFNYLPMPGVYIAFTNYNFRDGIFGSEFVGLANFEFLVKSGQLWQMTKNTILYNLIFIFLGNFLQIALAVMLNEIRNKWFKKVSQTVMFLPYFISAVLVGAIAFNVLNYDTGAINTLIRNLGGEPISFYSNSTYWPVIIVICQLWQNTGYGSIVYFAAIASIDAEMIEAAQVDGANNWQRIRYIILPSLKPTAIILILFSLGGILKGNFQLFWNLVGNNSQLFATTDIIETVVYRMMMAQNNFSTSSAVGLYQSIFGFILVMISNKLVKKVEPDYALF